MTFKITFNKPAFRQFIDGNEFKGLQIKLTKNGVVMFRPTEELSFDAVEFTARKRGGFEAFISGTNEEELLSAFQHDFGPYHMLNRKGNWIAATPFQKAGEPPKFEPSLRVLTRDEIHSVKKEQPISDEPEAYYDKLKWAYIVLANQKKGPGRPPHKIARAMQIRADFEGNDLDKMPDAKSYDMKAFFKTYAAITNKQGMDRDEMVRFHTLLGEFIKN